MNLIDQINGAFKQQEVKREKIMRLLLSKGATKRRTLKGTPTSKHTPIFSCPQMNASQPFMNHQNARLIFALGEAAGREFSEGIVL